MINMDIVADQVCRAIKEFRPKSKARRIGSAVDCAFSCIAGVAREDFEAMLPAINALAANSGALLDFHANEFDTLVDIWSPAAAQAEDVAADLVAAGFERLAALLSTEAVTA